MSDWKAYSVQQEIPCVRPGWAGVWDAVVSAATGKPRAATLESYTFSVWATQPVELRIKNARLEQESK